MSYKIFTAYAAHGDGGERGLGPIIGIFRTKELADDYAAGKGFWGSKGHVSKCNLLEIDTAEGYDYFLLAKEYPIDLDVDIEKRKNDRRKELLAAMSDFDKIVLGIKD